MLHSRSCGELISLADSELKLLPAFTARLTVGASTSFIASTFKQRLARSRLGRAFCFSKSLRGLICSVDTRQLHATTVMVSTRSGVILNIRTVVGVFHKSYRGNDRRVDRGSC